MRSILAAALALAVFGQAEEPIPSRVARPSDSLPKTIAASETWDLRAVEPNGRRAIVVRFWTKGNPWYIEWLWYERGRGVASYTVPVKPAAHTGPGVSMKEPHGHGSIRRVGQRWVLDAHASLSSMSSARLVLRAARPGITVGPLPASRGRAGWLSIVATGLVDGVVETPNGTMQLRGWYGAHVREWATYLHHETQAYVRRDLGLIWRSANDVRLIWGLEPFRTTDQTLTPDDSIWRGISARLGARPSVCTPSVRRAGLRQGSYPRPTTTLTARCGGSTLALHHPDGKIGATTFLGVIYTGLATSNVGGVGFLDQATPDS